MAPPCRCGRVEAEADERGPIPTLIEEERRGGNPILPEHACIQQFLHAASSIARSECTECRDDIFASARVVVIGGKNRRREMNAHCQEARRCRSAETLSGRKAGVGLDKGAWDRSTSVRITRSISNTPPGRTTKAGPAKRATARRPDDRPWICWEDANRSKDGTASCSAALPVGAGIPSVSRITTSTQAVLGVEWMPCIALYHRAELARSPRAGPAGRPRTEQPSSFIVKEAQTIDQ
ncbi:hypothetical protein ACCO45_003239 [Purpureocillium lilacinum]|uniref:Uncharacterized protein n=1 Tax=Purpureocillium lilacinum TaxID=33203 RepID=A0ACC4DZM4_PURLI